MHFLYPFFFLALFCLLIPVLIHFFHFRKRRKVEFSDIRFLRFIEKEFKNSRNIKRRLVLLSRILALGFLVAAFSRPVLNQQNQVNYSEAVSIYIDNSPSVSDYSNQNKNGLSLAENYTKELLKYYPENAEIRLITIDGTSHLDQYRNKQTMLRKLDNLNLEFQYKSFQITDALINYGSLKAGEDVIIISDFQKTNKDNIWSNLDSIYNYKLIPIQKKSNSNLYVDSIWVSEYLPFNKSQRISVLIGNSGNEDRESSVSLISDERLLGTNTLLIPANNRSSINFDVDIMDKGFVGEIQLQDDETIFDNTFHFSLNNISKRKIIELSNDKSSTVFQDVFFNTFLFEYQHLEPDRFDLSQLDRYDMVILNGLVQSEIYNSIVNRPDEYGFSVLVITDDKGFSNELFEFNQNALQDDRFYKSSLPQDRLPILDGVFEKDTDLSQAEYPLFRRPVSIPNYYSPILTNEFGEPVFSKLRFRNIFFLGVPLNDSWTNLARHALFVPLMYKLAYLDYRNERLFHYLKETTLELPYTQIASNDIISLVKDELRIIPNQWQRSGKRVIEVNPLQLTPGTYEVQSDSTHLGHISFNISKAESIYEFHSINELHNLEQNNRNVEVLTPEKRNVTLANTEVGWNNNELWRFAIVLALLFLLLEVLLIRFLK